MWVKDKSRDTWHWRTNCSKYPTGSNVEKSSSNPSSGELCNDCRAKENAGYCK